MRNITLLLALACASSAQPQLIDPGFEQPVNGPWQFTCPDDGWFQGSTAPNGGSLCARVTMISTTEPECYHNGDQTLPAVYQELPGVVNGDQITLTVWQRCEPVGGVPLGFMRPLVIFGWWTPPTISYVQDENYNTSLNWEQLTVNYTVSGLPPGETLAIFLGGQATGISNGTMFFDNAQITVNNSVVQLSPKLWLDGPYTQTTNLMTDDLRAQGLIPTTEPNTAIFGGIGGETVAPSILNITGNNAIVDWVRVELRTVASGPAVAMRNALLQRDGDVVATDGVSPVTLNSSTGNYYVAVRHRNHLAVMSAAPLMLNSTPTVIDFRAATTACYTRPSPFADLPRKTIGSQQLLWSGNVIPDDRLKYTGSTNDRDAILSAVGGVTPTNTVSGYWNADVNMDGLVKYTGTNNDRDRILENIGGVAPTASRIQQVP